MFGCQELARSLCFNVANATRDKKLYNENLLISQFTTDGTSVSTFTTEDLYDFLINEIQDVVNIIYNRYDNMTENTIKNILYIFYSSTNNYSLREIVTDRRFDTNSMIFRNLISYENVFID